MPVTARFKLTNGRTGTITADTQEQALAAIEELQATVDNPPLGPMNDPRGAVPAIASSVVAQPVGGLAGLVGLGYGAAEGLFDSDSELSALERMRNRAAERGEQFRSATTDALTIEPPNPASEQVVEAVGKVGEVATQAARMPVAGLTGAVSLATTGGDTDVAAERVRRLRDEGIGPVAAEAVYEATESPELAAIVEGIPTAVVTALGFKIGRMKKVQVDRLKGDIAEVMRAKGIDPTDGSAANIERMRKALQQDVDDFAARQGARPVTQQQPTVQRPTPAEPVGSAQPTSRVSLIRPDMQTPAQPTTVGRPTLDQPVDFTPRAAPAQATRVLSAIDDQPGAALNAVDDLAQQARREAFEALGVKPTRAQVTRTATDFQRQQELAKRSGRVRTALEEQNAQLAGQFDDAVARTGGEATRPTNTVTDAIVRRSSELDRRIGQAYRKAERSVGADTEAVRLNRLAEQVTEMMPSDRASKGLVSGVRGYLRQQGIIDKDGAVTRPVTVSEAETVRQFINDFYDSTSGRGRRMIRTMKESVDTDVFKTAGRDVFQEARQAKIDFERSLERAQVSRFDSARNNLVRDILENKIDPDDFVNKVVFSKGKRAQDLRQLRDYLNQTDDGVAAFNDLRAETLQAIKERAFTGPLDENGFQSLSRVQFERAINSIGRPKLEILFSADEMAGIDAFLQIAKLREPVPGTALGLGPSAQAIGKLSERLTRTPLIGDWLSDVIVDQQAKGALKARP